MPMYEYECERCGPFEVEQKLGAEALKTCPRVCDEKRCAGPAGHLCGATVKRLIPKSTSFVLKGSRWFKDGY